MKNALLKIGFVLLLATGAAKTEAQRFYVNIRPAAPPVVARPAIPHPGYVWVDGEYAWRGGRYVYVPGYWAAPRGRRVWHGGHWAHGARGHYWVSGYWR